MSELDSEVTPTVQTLSMVKKHKIGLFLHDGTKYRRVKKSQTLTLSMNPTETEYDYIADENPTTEVDSYKPSIDQDLTMYKGIRRLRDDFPVFFMSEGPDQMHM